MIQMRRINYPGNQEFGAFRRDVISLIKHWAQYALHLSEIMSSELSNAQKNFEAFQSNVNILSVRQTRITNAISLGFLEPKAYVNYAERARMQV